MSRSKLWIPALAMGCLVGALVHADDAVPASDATDAEASAEAPAAEPSSEPEVPIAEAVPLDESAQVGDPVADPPAALAPEEADAALAEGDTAVETPAEVTAPELGAIGYDSEGRQGRIHIVSKGDTLWEISDAYLGTPWVWPSIWRDNGQVENPHRIFPGDRIWITPSEMRKISAEEAARLLANGPPGSELLVPAAAESGEMMAPAVMPAPGAETVAGEQTSLTVSSVESTGLVTAEQFEAAASIIDRVPERLLLSQEDAVYIGLGEGHVAVGDQLSMFRSKERVFDPDTGKLLGYHVDFLGWVEVTEVHPESSKARIGMSTGEIEEGDRLIPRQQLPTEIALQASPDSVEGKISFFPQHRVVIGWNDYVYLNRGSVDGLEVGSPLEVFRPGFTVTEPARDEKVQVPDRVIGNLVVVRTTEESSVALITKAATELKLGDRFRGAESEADAPSETN